MHKITSLELLRTPIRCLVQLSKLRECEATDASKNFFLSQKKLLNVILRAKAQLHEKCFFLMNELFFAMQKTAFHEFELFCRKSPFRA